MPMNVHATAIALESSGFLIEGPSGSGKTSLALAAIEKYHSQSHFAALVADDQSLLEIANGKLIANCPPSLGGMAEMRGFGIVTIKWIESVVVDAVIRLIDNAEVERMPELKSADFLGIDVPVFELPQRQNAVSLPLLMQIVQNRRI